MEVDIALAINIMVACAACLASLALCVGKIGAK